MNQKDRQYNGQMKKDNNDLHNITQKSKDRVTRTTLKIGGEPRSSGRVGSYCFTCGTRIYLSTLAIQLGQASR